MSHFKEQFDTTSLNDFCNLLTEEITELATAEDKLKLVFVLIHIIEESQKALSDINTDNFVTELYNRLNAACERSEKQKESLIQKFSADQRTMSNIIDGSNDELQNLHDDIENKLSQFDKLIKEYARIRDKMKPEDVKQSKHK